MNTQLLVVKHETKELEILRDLCLSAQRITTSRGKNLAWLQFADYLELGGYRFRNDTESQWKTLEKIVYELSSMHPTMPTGKLTDILCHLVNTTISHTLHAQGKKPHPISAKTEPYRDDLHTTLIHFTSNAIYLPRHPWIKQKEKIHKTHPKWKAHDMELGEDIVVHKSQVDTYTHFVFKITF